MPLSWRNKILSWRSIKKEKIEVTKPKKALKIAFRNSMSQVEWILYIIFEFAFTFLYAGSAWLMYTVSDPVLFGYYVGIATGDSFFTSLHIF